MGDLTANLGMHMAGRRQHGELTLYLLLACVHFPHHCPCPFPANEDKFETGDGHRLCVSKGGFKAGEAARKVELARKGLL